MTSTPDVEQRHLTRLSAFVLRARRVQAHSLYDDYEALDVTDSVFREQGQVHMAPVGTKVPESLNGDLGPEWRRLTIPAPGDPAESMFGVDHSTDTPTQK